MIVIYLEYNSSPSFPHHARRHLRRSAPHAAHVAKGAHTPASHHLLHHFLHALHVAHFLDHVHDVAHASHLLEHRGVEHVAHLLHHLLRISLHLFHLGGLVLGASAPNVHLAHLLHHLLELLVLLNQLIDLLHPRARALRDSADAGLGQGRHAVELVVVHGVHHAQETLHAIGALLFLAFRDHVRVQAWDHADHLAERAHVQDRGKLVAHVAEGELTFLDVLYHLLLLVNGDGIFHSLH